MRDETAMDAALIIVPMIKQQPATPVVELSGGTKYTQAKALT